MCVVDRVGVRELRQNLSVYLRRVKDGETLEVTEHGHPVAVLGPPPRSGSIIDRLIAEGRATAPTGGIADLPPPPPRKPGQRPLSEVLQEMRDEERSGRF